MTQFRKLAIAGAVTALMMSATAAEAHVSYNLGASTANNNATGPWSGGAPVGYAASLPVTWIANVHNDVNPYASYEVSKANAIEEGAANTYAVETVGNRWNPSRSWGNALDFGLIDLHAAGNLLITVAADASQSSTFVPGFTLFSGWANAGTGNKHGSWNGPTASLPGRNPSNPGTLGATGLSYLGHASTTTEGGFISYLFTGLTAGHYSLWIGGNGPTGTTVGSQSYVANISASPVPVPGAVWLFGSALAGVVGLRRRKVAA